MCVLVRSCSTILNYSFFQSCVVPWAWWTERCDSCKTLAEKPFLSSGWPSILAWIDFQKSAPVKNFLGANLGEHDWEDDCDDWCDVRVSEQSKSTWVMNVCVLESVLEARITLGQDKHSVTWLQWLKCSDSCGASGFFAWIFGTS